MRAVISRRFAKRQQMQWTKRGTHLLLQTQTRTLDGTLRPLFERCIRGSPTTIETVPFKLSQREHPTLPDALQVGPEPFGPTRRTTTLGRDLHRMSAQTQAHYGIYSNPASVRVSLTHPANPTDAARTTVARPVPRLTERLSVARPTWPRSAASGPVASGPVASGPAASGPVTSGLVAAGLVAAGLVAAGPAAAGLVAARPAAAGLVASGPAAAGPVAA